MILCNHCKNFDTSNRVCSVIKVKSGTALSIPFRVPNGIKDVSCSAFAQKQYKSDVKYFAGKHLFSYNFKKNNYGNTKH